MTLTPLARPLPFLLALAGLPAAGKSTLAQGLARRCGAIVLSKDEIRARLYAPEDPRSYERAANQRAMAALYQQARAAIRQHPQRLLVVDGRTFSRPEDLAPVAELAAGSARKLLVAHLFCDDETARRRLEAPEAAAHVAANRSYGHYLELKARPMQLPGTRLKLDTGRLPAEACLDRCVQWLQAHAARPTP